MFNLGFSQNISITYENPLGIEINGNETTYKVIIINNSGAMIDSNSFLQISLPDGITYVNDTVTENFTDNSVCFNLDKQFSCWLVYIV